MWRGMLNGIAGAILISKYGTMNLLKNESNSRDWDI